jgi:hypothetical protein
VRPTQAAIAIKTALRAIHKGGEPKSSALPKQPH